MDPSTTRSATITYGLPATAVDEPLILPAPQTEDRPLGNVPLPHESPLAVRPPFRTASLSHGDTSPAWSPQPAREEVARPPANPLARLVNSRSFAIAYDMSGVGEQGVSKVELWGTRDGGKAWQSYGVDDDNRSPLEVTVDSDGEYGFLIVVQSAAGADGFAPQPGDTPELWVNVDLVPPQAQILSADARRSDAGGELAIRWQADDDNLAARPIALFYSSRPAGPWTPIATSLENGGEFDWQVERHVPRRVYLKLEVRDTAGNVAAHQTSAPIVVESEPAVASWKRLPPVN